MSLDENIPETVQELILPQARIFFKLTEKKEVSYKDLYEKFLNENGVNNEESSPEESESENYSYPAFMQRIIERLDKYGQLALREQIGIHKSDPRKKRKVSEDLNEKLEGNEKSGSEESEDSCELYYDLSDNFIDDSDLAQNGNAEESDFQLALNQGFYTVDFEEYKEIQKKLNKNPQKTPRKKNTERKESTPKIDFKKKKEVNIDHLDIIVKELLEKLKVLYETKRKEGNAAPFPKGSAELLEKLVQIIDQNPQADYEGLYNFISQTSGQSPENVKVQFEKLRSKFEKSKTQSEYKKKVQLFKKKVANSSFQWNPEAQQELRRILSQLYNNVSLTNASLGSRSKKNSKPLVVFEEEEEKLIQEVKKLNVDKLGSVDLRAEFLQPEILMPTFSENFIDPTYNELDFQNINE